MVSAQLRSRGTTVDNEGDDGDLILDSDEQDKVIKGMLAQQMKFNRIFTAIVRALGLLAACYFAYGVVVTANNPAIDAFCSIDRDTVVGGRSGLLLMHVLSMFAFGLCAFLPSFSASNQLLIGAVAALPTCYWTWVLLHQDSFPLALSYLAWAALSFFFFFRYALSQLRAVLADINGLEAFKFSAQSC